MGSCICTSGITINLDQNNLVYFTDEILSGTVNWSNTNQTLRVKEIYIMFIGEVAYTTQRIVANARGVRHHVTKYNRSGFYSAKFSLIKSQSEEETIDLTQGQYSWPFRFSLTHHLPPTLNSPRSYPHISYYLQVVIDKPWYKPNPRERRYLTIYPRVNLLQHPQWLQRTLFGKQNRKEISFKGIINKIGVVPGDSIEFTIEIDNPNEILIKHIDLSIHQLFMIAANSHKENIFETKLPTIENTNRQQIKEMLSIMTPDLFLPPTYQFRSTTHTHASVHVKYLFRLSVKVEGIFTNFDLDIPIIIATDPKSHVYEPSTSIVQYNEDDLPPSYDSVIQPRN